MVHFVRAGGHFTKDALLAQSIIAGTLKGTPPLVHIARMEDGRLVLHDGHHRAVACHIAKRDSLHPDEYEMVDYSYRDYYELHPEKGWFTPFDIMTEVRCADFSRFKDMARRLYLKGDLARLEEYVRENRDGYVEPRLIHTIEELMWEVTKNPMMSANCVGRY